MLFRDKKGRILVSEDVDQIPLWELEERGIHVYEQD